MRKLKYRLQKIISMSITVILVMLTHQNVQAEDGITKVSVSNHILYILSQAVTKNTPTTVNQLLNNGDVGHHGSLTPQDHKTVEDSQYVVWFGDALESNLSNTLDTAPNAISLLDMDAFNRHSRRGVTLEIIENTEDPHIWLDPENAKAIVRALTVIHSHAAPEYKEVYEQNSIEFAKQLDAIVQEQQHLNANQRKYWASHDAFQYIEKALNIQLAGSLTTDHELPPKASQILWLKQNRPYATMCLLSQGKQQQGIINKLSPVNTQVLIEDMSDYDSYLTAWKDYAANINQCLADS